MRKCQQNDSHTHQLSHSIRHRYTKPIYRISQHRKQQKENSISLNLKQSIVQISFSIDNFNSSNEIEDKKFSFSLLTFNQIPRLKLEVFISTLN